MTSTSELHKSMSVVVDANIIVVLVTHDPRTELVERQVKAWLAANEELHAPDLLPYEVANAITRLVAAGRLASGDVPEIWSLISGIPLQFHPLTSGTETIAIALELGRISAYDAAYLSLARQLNADLWTLDGPLARNAVGLGFPVHLIA